MRSVRLDPELDEKLRRAARSEHETVSEFIRRAVEQRADDVLDNRHSETFDDVIGVVRGGGGRARRSGKAFTEQLVSKKRR